MAGGYIRGATPVPIPNTAVKPAEPMILLQRESRSPPALNPKAPGLHKEARGFLLAPDKQRFRQFRILPANLS